VDLATYHLVLTERVDVDMRDLVRQNGVTTFDAGNMKHWNRVNISTGNSETTFSPLKLSK